MFKRNKKYMEWNEYKSMIDTIEDYLFSQGVRRESIKNSLTPQGVQK